MESEIMAVLTLRMASNSEEAGGLSSRTQDLSFEGKDTNVSENEKEKGEKNAKKAKAVDFSGFVAKAEVWDKGVPMCIFHSLEKAKEYVEKKRKLDAANAEYQKKAAEKAEVEKPKLRRNARGLLVLPTERHRCRQPAKQRFLAKFC